MPATRDRTLNRKVLLYNHQDPDTVLGGLRQLHTVTNINFYLMVEIVIKFESDYVLHDQRGHCLPRNNEQLREGKYYIVSGGAILINNEDWMLRTTSLQRGTRIKTFTDEVRRRDGRCGITKEEAEDDIGDWTGYQAAHIFPLAYERNWQGNNFSRWITILPEQGGAINSVQNGLLLRTDLHEMWNAYIISVNPDDGYKVVDFNRDKKRIAGQCLDRKLLDDPGAPHDQLLRWHFRQAVLANMRGSGEPLFEHEFPPGSDITQDIREGPMAAERMEFELFSRFASQKAAPG